VLSQRLLVFAGELCWKLQPTPPATFQKPCKELHYKKPTQINSTEKKLLLLQPAPPAGCNNQSRKTAKPYNINANTVKNNAERPKAKKKPRHNNLCTPV